MRKTRSWSLVSVLLLALGACAGEDTSEVAAVAESGGGGAITIFTDRTELFFEYPPMVAGAPGGVWAVHLTNLADFQAVTVGRLTLEFEDSDGRKYITVDEQPSRPGVFGPTPSLPTAGMYDLVMTLEGSQVSDEILVGQIRVYASQDDLPPLVEAEEVGISFLKEQQWPIDFATVVAEQRVVSPGLEVTGELGSAPGAVADIAAPVAGIVRWDLNRASPAEGALVEEGEPLVRLSPVGGDDTYASLKARAEGLQREVERAERLVAVEAVPARRLEDARHDLTVVQAQLEALDASPDETYTLTLRAPISGSVIRRDFVTGQRVEAGASLLTLLDPRRLQAQHPLVQPSGRRLGEDDRQAIPVDLLVGRDPQGGRCSGQPGQRHRHLPRHPRRVTELVEHGVPLAVGTTRLHGRRLVVGTRLPRAEHRL